MNIVIAPDSFKGSLSALQAAKLMKQAALDMDSRDNVVMKPMADGGEGTLDALLTSSDGERVSIRCTGPLGRQIDTSYAITQKNTAIIEGASIAGLVQVPVEERNPDVTTSYGIGEVILDALEHGCTKFVIGLGGSATNDGGLGMLLALGMQGWDKQGEAIGPYGKDLFSLDRVSLEGMDRRLANVSLSVACDVDNPLCGARGASAVYGPQKGATTQQVDNYDAALNHFGSLVEKAIGRSFQKTPGAGAAGGLGFAMLVLGAELVSGAALLAETTELEKEIAAADLVLTGEGQSDEQTLYGKAPGFIAEVANKHGVPTVLLSGSLSGNQEALRNTFAGCFSIVNKPLSLEACMEQAGELLEEQTKQVLHFMRRKK